MTDDRACDETLWSSPMSNCEICGEPMPDGEEMFKYHGLSGQCPKPPKEADSTDARVKTAYDTFRGGMFPEDLVPAWDEVPSWVRDVAKVAYLQGTLDAKSAERERAMDGLSRSIQRLRSIAGFDGPPCLQISELDLMEVQLAALQQC